MLNMSKELDYKAKKFDVFIAPPELKNYKILDPEKALEVFDIGYNATKNKLEGTGNKEAFIHYCFTPNPLDRSWLPSKRGLIFCLILSTTAPSWL